MTQYSYSRVSLFEDCPYHFKLKYIDKLAEIIDYNRADHPLLIGHALHTGIEHDVKTAINEYYDAYPVLTDRMIEEAMKLELLIPKVKEFLEESFSNCKFIHEYKIDHDDFIGYVDLIIKAPDGTCAVMDFKYSNHIENYLDSGQLHIYKDRLEQDGFKVKKLAYLFVPKTSIKQKDNEDLFHFRKRLIEEVSKTKVIFVPIDFDETKIVRFMDSIQRIESEKDYPKNVSGDCFSCKPRFAPNYLEALYNEKGEIELVLPKNERRERKIDTKPDFWIYGDSYVGKSTFVDHIDNVLFLNTDGNTDNTTAPVIPIKDEARKEGRRTIRKLAWETFLDVIDELETEDNDYEAVAIDLIEDLKEHCRYYVFEKNGWEHESDGSYGKGWSKVTTEWQKAIKRMKALGYQLIYISKERVEEITLKGGAKRTVFKPNIDDKFANFLTGTVDLTIRAFTDADDERFLQLAKKNNVFGGGRFAFQVDTVELDYEKFLEELTAAQEGKATKKKERSGRKDEEKTVKIELEDGKTIEVTTENTVEEKPKRTRKRRDPEDTQSEEAEDKPKRQRRTRKLVDEDETPPGEEDYVEEVPKRTGKHRTRVNS